MRFVMRRKMGFWLMVVDMYRQADEDGREDDQKYLAKLPK